VRDLVEAARPELKDIAAEAWFDRAAKPAAPAQRSAADKAERHSNAEDVLAAVQARLEALERRIAGLPYEPVNQSENYEAPKKRSRTM